MNSDISSTTCPECQKEVSKDAPTCPACGFKLNPDPVPMPDRPTLNGWFSLGVILTLFFVFMLLLLAIDSITNIVLLVISYIVLAAGILLILTEVVHFVRQRKLYKLAQADFKKYKEENLKK
jgi:hypothetical protein